MQELIKRINELAAKKRTAGLSSAEQEERGVLYRQYIDIIKGRVVASLEEAGFQHPHAAAETKLQIIPPELRKPPQ